MKRLFIFLAVGIALLILTVGIVAWLSLQPQPWYDPPDFKEPNIASLADLAERRMNEEFHKVRPTDEVWHLRITEQAVNAWLSGRLEGWLTHDQQIEMPKEVHDPQIHVTKEGVWLAANIEIEGGDPRPLAVELWVWIDEGTMFAEPISVRLGRVPVPLSLFESVMAELQNDMRGAEPISVRLGRVPVPLSLFESVMAELQNDMRGVEAITPLMDDREVHILGIDFEEEAFVLTCQTHLP